MFLYNASAGEVFLLSLAVTLVVINISKKYNLLYAMNLISVIAFLAFYVRDINAFGVLCAILFLVVTTGVSFLIAKSARRNMASSLAA